MKTISQENGFHCSMLLFFHSSRGRKPILIQDEGTHLSGENNFPYQTKETETAENEVFKFCLQVLLFEQNEITIIISEKKWHRKI